MAFQNRFDEGDYVAYDYEDAFGLDAPEGPCEFCGKLFPLMLLIEHETGCEPEATSYNLETEVTPPPTIETQNQNITPKPVAASLNALIAPKIENVKVEIIEKNKTEVRREAEKMQTQNAEVSLIEEGKLMKRAENVQTEDGLVNVMNELKKNNQFQKKKTNEFEIKGETLMSFGAAESPSKESDKNMQQDCAEEVEDTEDIYNLSDDDCSETLEDFWQRANVALKRMRVKNT